ncbi:MAG: chalcone isomerase family protein [Burkholderiales bacterium]|nr:chalcone isomerase family protein [Burkholderiales bacterium]
MRKLARFGLSLLMVCATMAQAQARLELDGIPVEESQVVAGTKLVLNGAAVQKKAFLKTNIAAFYLTEKRQSLDGILQLDGPQRLEIIALRTLLGWQIARQSVLDIKTYATDDEVKQLSAELDAIEGVYADVRMNRGDVLLIDWIPGEGIVSSINGKTLAPPLNKPLMWALSLRPTMSEHAPERVRDMLLGVTVP